MPKIATEKVTQRLKKAKTKLGKLGKAASITEVRAARKKVKRLGRKLFNRAAAAKHTERRHGSKTAPTPPA